MAGINHVTQLSGTVQAVHTLLGARNYEHLRNKPSINGVELVGDVSLEELGIFSPENSGSVGLSGTARKLLIDILRNAVYISDQSGNIAALQTALASGAESDEEVPVPVTYSITNALTNVTTSNTAAAVGENEGYTATLTAMDGYELSAVTVTMGGVDVTATAYSSGVVSIGAVTGDVVITATAAAQETEDDPVTYGVMNQLTNVSTSNAQSSVEENTAYTTTLTAADGYELSAVTVTMGGVDITATVYSSGVVTIDSVNGDLIITAAAAEISAGAVNLFDKDTMVTEGHFIGTAGTAIASAGGKYATIPITGGRSYAMQRRSLSFKNGDAGNITLLDSDENVVYQFVPAVSYMNGEYFCYYVADDTVDMTLASNPAGLTYQTDVNKKGVTFTTDASCAYLRLTVAYNGADSVEDFMVEEGNACHDYVAFGA